MRNLFQKLNITDVLRYWYNVCVKLYKKSFCKHFWLNRKNKNYLKMDYLLSSLVKDSISSSLFNCLLRIVNIFIYREKLYRPLFVRSLFFVRLRYTTYSIDILAFFPLKYFFFTFLECHIKEFWAKNCFLKKVYWSY